MSHEALHLKLPVSQITNCKNNLAQAVCACAFQTSKMLRKEPKLYFEGNF